MYSETSLYELIKNIVLSGREIDLPFQNLITVNICDKNLNKKSSIEFKKGVKVDSGRRWQR